MEWWERQQRLWRLDWEQYLLEEDEEGTAALRACAYAGRPFADEAMVNEWGACLHRTCIRDRPKKRERAAARATCPDSDQFALFEK